ncbi:hypothetical protein GmHk_12G034624 [Glycine max]|nr:hypothetical protein GmHk_12G034624 [Glycine max]
MGARMGTEGSNAKAGVNPSGEEDGVDVLPTVGLYVQQDHSTHLVALGKIYEEGSTIHSVAYADDMVRFSTVMLKSRSPHQKYSMSGRPLTHSLHGQHSLSNLSNDVEADDPLRGLIISLCDIYDKPIELLFDGTKFGILDVDASVFLTYFDINEIISGLDKWSSSLGHGFVYRFLEPKSIHNAKNRHGECQRYIETWVKESQRGVYLGAYLNQAHWQQVVLCPITNVVVWLCLLRKKSDIHIKATINNAINTLKTTLHGHSGQVAPKWIEVKIHVQTRGYECGYYVMHWMWNIVSGELKTDWTMWFGDDTSLDKETMTTIHKKWVAYFLKVKNIRCRRLNMT